MRKSQKSAKTQPIWFKAGEWEVFLQTAEGKKTPLFKTMSERLSFQRDFMAKLVFRRMR